MLAAYPGGQAERRKPIIRIGDLHLGQMNAGLARAGLTVVITFKCGLMSKGRFEWDDASVLHRT